MGILLNQKDGNPSSTWILFAISAISLTIKGDEPMEGSSRSMIFGCPVKIGPWRSSAVPARTISSGVIFNSYQSREKPYTISRSFLESALLFGTMSPPAEGFPQR